MRQLLVGSVAVASLALAGSAVAADMPVKAPIDKAPPPVQSHWTGFYIGANGGAGWGQSCWTLLGSVPPAGPVQDEGCHDLSGGLFGAQAGFNWQVGNWVLGVEGQGDWTRLTGTTVLPSETFLSPISTGRRLNPSSP